MKEGTLVANHEPSDLQSRPSTHNRGVHDRGCTRQHASCNTLQQLAKAAAPGKRAMLQQSCAQHNTAEWTKGIDSGVQHTTCLDALSWLQRWTHLTSQPFP
jgi:hypothetical protein